MARLRRKKSLILICLSIFIFGGLFYYFGPFSVRASGDLIKIFPASLSLEPAASEGGWQNAVAAFSQDLGGLATFEEFNTENSAFIFGDSPPRTIFTATPPAEGLAFVTSFQEGVKSVLEFFDFGVADGTKVNKIKNVQLRFSLAASAAGGTDAEQNAEPRGKLLIEYQSEGDSLAGEAGWQQAGDISPDQEISNALNGGYFLYALPVFENWEAFESLKIRFTYLEFPVSSFKLQEVYLDAAWLEVEYEEIQEEILPPEIAGKKNFRLDEKPEFVFLKGSKAKFKIHRARLRLPNGIEENADFSLEEIDGNYRLKLGPSFAGENFGGRPGKYLIKLEVEKGGKIYYLEQEFTWGVLAINTNKSIYISDKQQETSDTAYIQMAALKDDGHTICDASLKLEIRNSKSETTILSTENSGIQYSGECGPNNVTSVPDYFVHYQVGGPGTYQMKLTNLDNGYEIIDSFEVRESVPFDVERMGPTRIYPPAIYQMTLKIKANQDFIGEVVEYVPASFEIIKAEGHGYQAENAENSAPLSLLSADSASISIQGETKQIIWNVTWRKGEEYEFFYQFDAPDISPYLYLLGPLEFYE